MKRLLTTLMGICLSLILVSQNFFREDFDKKKAYVLLANPTVNNIKTINYLTNNKLLKINTRKMKFVGIYYKDQKYDFNDTRRYIDEKNLRNYYMHEVKCDLYKSSLFENNDCSDELKFLFDNSVGIFFFGGADIPPDIYGEENTHSVVTDAERNYFEITFLFHLLGGYRNESIKPFLNENPWYFISGFCLGLQTMNVATGGTLIQDIPSEIFGAESPEAAVKAGRPNLHRNYWQQISDDTLLMRINFHPIKFTDNTLFQEKINIPENIEPLVYSNHHQAIKKLGKGLQVTAVSIDGKIIEAAVHNRYPHVLGVQFHPEVPALYEDMEELKFHPDDTPRTYHEIIGSVGMEFHKKYWRYISGALRKSMKEN